MQLLLVVSLAVGGSPPPSSSCSPNLDRATVIDCARRNSPRLRADQERIAATKGDALAARTVLPDNPELEVSLAGRRADGVDPTLNVYATVRQSIEIGGQRRVRMAVVDAERDVATQHAAATERDVLAGALLAYYDLVAATQELVLVEQAARTVQRLEALATERFDAGLGTALERELAAAAVARHSEQVALARGQVREASARLAHFVGLDPTGEAPVVHGTLDPLVLPEGALAALAEQAVQQRPQVAGARAQRNAEQSRMTLLRRERIPNPSLSVFVQRDGFNEQVVGGGLSFPIPLPAPLGRTNRGRIEASRLRVREADARIEAEARHVRVQTAQAFFRYRARQDAVAAYPDAAAQRMQDALAGLSAEIEAGRLPVRDALISQETLLESLLRHAEARHALCRASVDLAWAAGLSLDGGAR